MWPADDDWFREETQPRLGKAGCDEDKEAGAGSTGHMSVLQPVHDERTGASSIDRTSVLQHADGERVAR
jgi:hypothetical protein